MQIIECDRLRAPSSHIHQSEYQWLAQQFKIGDTVRICTYMKRGRFRTLFPAEMDMNRTGCIHHFNGNGFLIIYDDPALEPSNSGRRLLDLGPLEIFKWTPAHYLIESIQNGQSKTQLFPAL